MHCESEHLVLKLNEGSTMEEFTALCQGHYDIVGTFSNHDEAMESARILRDTFCEQQHEYVKSFTQDLKEEKVTNPNPNYIVYVTIMGPALDRYQDNETAVRMTYSEYEQLPQFLRDVDATYRYALELHMLDTVLQTLEQVEFNVSFPGVINALFNPQKNVQVCQPHH